MISLTINKIKLKNNYKWYKQTLLSRKYSGSTFSN